MIQSRDLPAFLVFAEVVRHGSFTAAAKTLGLSKSVVSEQVSALEERCGLRLLERSTRRLRPTQAGEQVLAATAAVEAAARTLAAVVEEHHHAPVGTLRVATTHDLGPRLVAPVAARLVAEHPGLDVDVVADDRPQSLMDGGFDLAVRLGRPRESSHVVVRLGMVSEPIVAAPFLAAPFANAVRPRELVGVPWVRHAVVDQGSVLTFLGPNDEADLVAVTPRARANTGEGVRALLLGGAGFGVLPEHLINDDLRRGALVRLCSPWVWKNVSLFAELPSASRKPRRVQLFLDAVKRVMAEGAGALSNSDRDA